MPQNQRTKYDVFLSHNRKDKPAVKDLKKRLAAQGLRVWYDEDELRPGIPWQQLLESGIESSGSVAVLVGRDGCGPWEGQEMEFALRLAVEDKRPVIPVLLPGAPSQPNLPRFLGNRTWVDLRSGFSDEGLEKLVWGITGTKPRPSVKSTQSAHAATSHIASPSAKVGPMQSRTQSGDHSRTKLAPSKQVEPVRVISLASALPARRSVYKYDRERLSRCGPDELVRFIGVTGKTVFLPELNSEESFFSSEVARRSPLPLAISRGVKVRVILMDPESPEALFRSGIESGFRTNPVRRLLQRDALAVASDLVPTYVRELHLSPEYIREHLEIRRTSIGIGFSVWLFHDVALAEPLHFGKQEGRPHLCNFARLLIPSGNEEYKLLEKHFEAIWNSDRTKELPLGK